MAEWWNKKYEFKLWSSLWLFLREVKGIDDTRARKYLEQLLENGYDTVDVLKLATKQDLVDDANILPGDALRIIATALALDARRDADHAEVFRQEREHGGEVRSEFSLMQETKAVQETVAQGNGLLPLPRHTILQQGSERHVRTRIGRIYYACGLCMITCPSEHWLRLHFNGKKHADRMEQGEDDGRRTAVRYAGTSASGQLVISPKAYHCSLCNITCTGKNDLINHFKGRRHQALMEEDSDDEDPQAAFEYVPPRPTARFRPVGLSQPAGLCSQFFQKMGLPQNAVLAHVDALKPASLVAMHVSHELKFGFLDFTMLPESPFCIRLSVLIKLKKTFAVNEQTLVENDDKLLVVFFLATLHLIKQLRILHL